jgi:hypothetical protein
MASGTLSPWVVEPVSGLRATKPPSSAGISTAVKSMSKVCRREADSQDRIFFEEAEVTRNAALQREAGLSKGTEEKQNSDPESFRGWHGWRKTISDPQQEAAEGTEDGWRRFRRIVGRSPRRTPASSDGVSQRRPTEEQQAGVAPSLALSLSPTPLWREGRVQVKVNVQESPGNATKKRPIPRRGRSCIL